MASRPSALIYCDSFTPRESSQSFDGDALYQAKDGVPLLWFFAFGGRNIWNPGDSIEQRGGAVGERNPYETPVEVALTRLEYAESALSTSAPYLWPWLSPISILRRKLMAKSRTGFLRVAAPWLVSLQDKDFARWRQATAFVENCVHYISIGHSMQGNESLRHIKPFTPFVPEGNPTDQKRFRALKLYPGVDEPLRVAYVMLGEPDNPGPFEIAARRDVARALEDYEVLANQPISHSQESLPTSAVDDGPAPGQAPGGGILSKVTGLFRRK